MLFRKKKNLEDVKTECIKNMAKLIETMSNDTVRILFSIKDVDDLVMPEKEKHFIRNNLINKVINDSLKYTNKIKELSKTAKSIR